MVRRKLPERPKTEWLHGIATFPVPIHLCTQEVPFFVLYFAVPKYYFLTNNVFGQLKKKFPRQRRLVLETQAVMVLLWFIFKLRQKNVKYRLHKRKRKKYIMRPSIQVLPFCFPVKGYFVPYCSLTLARFFLLLSLCSPIFPCYSLMLSRRSPVLPCFLIARFKKAMLPFPILVYVYARLSSFAQIFSLAILFTLLIISTRFISASLARATG